MEEYQSSGLADDVRSHLEALVLAEQREQEKATGRRPTVARKRPATKEKPGA